MVLHFAHTDSSVLNGSPDDIVSTRLSRISGHRPHEYSWPFGDLSFGFIFVFRLGEKNGIRHTAALYVREASIRVRSKMQMSI